MNRLSMALATSLAIAVALNLSAQERRVSRGTEFELPTPGGSTVSLREGGEARVTVVCFLGIECPLAKLYAPRLQRLADEFRGQGVRFIGVSSNQQDSLDELAEFSKRSKLEFECGKDYDNVVADRFGVKRTPEVFVLDENLVIHYRGRVDDQYLPGIARSKPNRADLRIALGEVLTGQDVSVSKTEPEGCLLGRVKKPVDQAEFTYAKHVSRILQDHCVECHRDGEIGPFTMDPYEEVVGWADMILETIENGRMPPWHADPNHGQFLNQRRLSESEKNIVRRWVADGAPFGDADDLPPEKEFVAGWRLPRQPDLVVEMRDRPFHVPADGTVEYQYFVVDPGFKKDKWIAAAEVIPGNRQVVHHSIVFVRPPDGRQSRGVGWLAAYVPGQQNLEFNPKRARFVPAGSKLVFQQHYTTTGTEQQDITKVGMVFSDEQDVAEELMTLIALDQQFEIKPQEADHRVNASVPWFPKHGKLLALSPHMHFRGKSFSADITTDRKETLLSVPNYDFNWQHNYQLKEPIDLGRVKRLDVEVVFDNSPNNPSNPDPTQFVTWGDQTWEEMAIAFFDVAIPRRSQKKSKNDSAAKKSSPAVAKKTNPKVEEFVSSFFDRFDRNRDDLIIKTELPLSIASWAYSDYESDGSEGLTRAEIRKEAEKRFK